LRVAHASIAHSLPTEIIRSDPDLALIVERWAELPEAIRAGILAMVRASVPSEGHRVSDVSDETHRRKGGNRD